jgi:hypothetical protein
MPTHSSLMGALSIICRLRLLTRALDQSPLCGNFTRAGRGAKGAQEVSYLLNLRILHQPEVFFEAGPLDRKMPHVRRAHGNRSEVAVIVP